MSLFFLSGIRKVGRYQTFLGPGSCGGCWASLPQPGDNGTGSNVLFQLPECWKRKPSRISKRTGHVWWGTAGFPVPEDEQTTTLPFLPLKSPLGQQVLQLNVPRAHAFRWGPPGTCFSFYPGSCSSRVSFLSSSQESVTFGVTPMTLLLSCRAPLGPAAPCPASCGGRY